MTTPSRRSSRRSTASDTPQRTKRARPTKKAKQGGAATPKPGKELIGQRIAISWPATRTFYDARCIAYDAKKKQHMVIYDEDNSLEELNLSKRKYKKLPPLEEEAMEGSIVGKKILLKIFEIEANSDASKSSYTAIVLRSSTVDIEQNLGFDDDEEQATAENEKDDAVLHLVVYPSNEYITTVDLQKHEYTIVDMLTEEKIRDVNPDDDDNNDEEEDNDNTGQVVENAAAKETRAESKEKELKDMDEPKEGEKETSASATNPTSSRPIAKTTAPALQDAVEAPPVTPVTSAASTYKADDPPAANIHTDKVTEASPVASEKEGAAPDDNIATTAEAPKATPDKIETSIGDSTTADVNPTEKDITEEMDTTVSVPSSNTENALKATFAGADAPATTQKEKPASNDGSDSITTVEPNATEKPSETALAAASIVGKPVDVSMSVGNTNTEKDNDDNNDSMTIDPLMGDEPPLVDPLETNENEGAAPPVVVAEKVPEKAADYGNGNSVADTKEVDIVDVEMVDTPESGDAKDPGESIAQAVKAAMDATNLLDAGPAAVPDDNNNDAVNDIPSEGSTIPIPVSKEGDGVEKTDAAITKKADNAYPDAMEIEKETKESAVAVKSEAAENKESASKDPEAPPAAKATEIEAPAAAPLTVENVKALDQAQPGPESATPENSKGADGNVENPAPGGTDVAVQDEDSKTISDGENEQWVATSSNKLEDPKSVEKTFVAIITTKEGKKVERIAYVDSYLSSGSHFIEFHDKEGGNMHITLTTENCRVLTKAEVDALGGVKNEGNIGGANGSGTKRKMANGNGTNKRQRSNTPTKVPPGPPIDASLVGKCITVMWPGNGGKYKCLVIGCAEKNGVMKHKVFYVEDESTETIELSKRTWNMGRTEQLPWNSTGLVGKRLYVYWEGEYTDDASQKKAEDLFGKDNCKVPYEVFVVKFLGPHKYRLLYTIDDNLEDRVLTDDDRGWNVLEDGVNEVDGLPIIAWTDEDGDE